MKQLRIPLTPKNKIWVNQNLDRTDFVIENDEIVIFYFYERQRIEIETQLKRFDSSDCSNYIKPKPMKIELIEGIDKITRKKDFFILTTKGIEKILKLNNLEIIRNDLSVKVIKIDTKEVVYEKIYDKDSLIDEIEPPFPGYFQTLTDYIIKKTYHTLITDGYLTDIIIESKTKS